MPFHALVMDDLATYLHTSYDLDGLVLELVSVSGIKACLHCFRLPVFESRHLMPHFNSLKKHIPLQGLKEMSMRVLRSSVMSVHLGVVDGGLNLNVSSCVCALGQAGSEADKP